MCIRRETLISFQKPEKYKKIIDFNRVSSDKMGKKKIDE